MRYIRGSAAELRRAGLHCCCKFCPSGFLCTKAKIQVDCIEHFLKHHFSLPPVKEAQLAASVPPAAVQAIFQQV